MGKELFFRLKKWRLWAESFCEVKSLSIKFGKFDSKWIVIRSYKEFFSYYKFFHLGNWKDHCELSLCPNILEAAKPIRSETRKNKQHISVDDLQKIFQLCNGLEGSLLELRNLCFIVLSFVGFL